MNEWFFSTHDFSHVQKQLMRWRYTLICPEKSLPNLFPVNSHRVPCQIDHAVAYWESRPSVHLILGMTLPMELDIPKLQWPVFPFFLNIAWI
jgi:hypothetical protein